MVAFRSFDFTNLVRANSEGRNFEQNSEIFVNLNSKKVAHTWPEVDRCCALPTGPGEKFEIRTFDDIEKISCHVDPSVFYRKFVETRQPVILIGCQDNWPAKNWTVEGSKLKRNFRTQWYNINLTRLQVS